MNWNLINNFLIASAESSGAANTLEEAAQETKKKASAFGTWLSNALPGMIGFAMKVLIALVVFFVGIKLIRVFIRHNQKRMENKDLDKGVAQFLNSVLKFTLYALLIFFILAQFGLTASSVAAILASSGLTLGLALQGSLSNFAGGVMILMQKPFVIGDYIVEDTHGNEGIVTNISMIYTTLRTIDNQSIVIPNGTLANTSLRNLTHAKKRMEDLSISVGYDSDLKLVKVLLEQTAKEDPSVLKDEPIQSFVRELADSSVQMGLRCWVKTDDYLPVKWRLLEKIRAEFARYNIEIPYPQVTVSYEKDKKMTEKEQG